MTTNSKNTRGKLTPEHVAEIRRLRATGMTNKAIAAQFGVAPQVVSRIVCNLCYRVQKQTEEVPA